MCGGIAVGGIIESGGFIILLIVGICICDRIESGSLILYSVVFLVLPHDNPLLLTRCEDKRIEQFSEGKSIRHPGLMHIQDVAHAK